MADRLTDAQIADAQIARDDLAIQAPGEALGVTTLIETPERELSGRGGARNARPRRPSRSPPWSRPSSAGR